jgi:hypothetical protein
MREGEKTSDQHHNSKSIKRFSLCISGTGVDFYKTTLCFGIKIYKTTLYFEIIVV